MHKFIIFLSVLYFVSFPGYALVLEDLAEQGKLEETLNGKKIGYYVGSFDPLHKGHEEVAVQPVNEKKCDYTIIYPAWGNDRYKDRVTVSTRLDMLFSVFKDHPHVIVTRLNPQEMQKILTESAELKIKDKSTVKPKYGITFVGIIGSDVALGLPKDLRKEAVFMRGVQVSEDHKEDTVGGIIALPVETFIVHPREGDDLRVLNGKIGERSFVEMKGENNSQLSSTLIRKAIQKNKSIDTMVSPSVKKIIQEKNLYR